jgi:3,4-dihydroxyphthalate decarboxylase
VASVFADAPALRETVATACRILGRRGMVDGVLGHVSVRLDDGDILIRCRGPHERGVAFTQTSDVRRVRDGAVVDGDGWDPPKELPLHTRVLAGRPDFAAVVHAHPMSALLCGLAGLTPRAVFGAFNIPAMRIARAGVPVYPKASLISRDDLADEVVAAMGERQVCLLKWHGIVVGGESVESALVTAVNLDVLLSVTVSLAQLPANAPDLSNDELADLPDLGSRFNDELAWRALVAEYDAHPTSVEEQR